MTSTVDKTHDVCLRIFMATLCRAFYKSARLTMGKAMNTCWHRKSSWFDDVSTCCTCVVVRALIAQRARGAQICMKNVTTKRSRPRFRLTGGHCQVLSV